MVTKAGEIEGELYRLKQWLAADFAAGFDELVPLFLEPHSGRPLYLSHLPIVLETLQIESLPAEKAEALSAAYVYLTSAFYCVDALVDGHPQLEQSSSVALIATALPLLISATCKRLQQAALANPAYQDHTLISLVHESLLELRTATQSEIEFCRDCERAVDYEKEAFHLAGRSATIIFLYRAAGYVTDTKVDNKLLACVRKILVAIQLGDDVTDWRDDFAAKKWTPFLRQCYAKGARSFGEFEQLILLDGEFEAALVIVAKKLMNALDDFPVDRHSRKLLARFVDSQTSKVRNEIQRAISEKLRAGVIYEQLRT